MIFKKILGCFWLSDTDRIRIFIVEVYVNWFIVSLTLILIK